VFYLHNPESQLADVSREVFRQRLKLAFAMLERAVEAGKLRHYGVATWNAFRVPEGSRDYISLAETVAIAEEAGGQNHHFRFIQLPFNLAMAEAYGLANQTLQQKNVSLLTAAMDLGVRVIGSATLYQGRLTHGLPPGIQEALGMKTEAETAIQFARSAPGLSTALIGMGHQRHVAVNLQPALLPPTPLKEWTELFRDQ
jgi:aryl-alcohol dehydrogenase-like predicted oxidoreductase